MLKHKRLTAFVLALLLALLPFFLPIGRENSKPAALSTGAEPFDFGLAMPQNSAKSAIVIDGATGNILCSKNPNERRGNASTTKIMTALVAIENCHPDTEFQIPKEAVGIEGSSVYLKEGECLTLRELLYCLLLESGNDAATAIAICVAGSRQAFVDLMNQRARELNLTDTHFANPHGLSNENHYTTALELAIITAAAFEYPLFAEIVATKRANVRYCGSENGRALVNHNKLLFGYEGALGVKTGYTAADGRCLVSAASRNGMFIIAVSLNDPCPTATHRTLLDYSFENFEQKKIASPGEFTAEIPVEEGEAESVVISNPVGATLCLPKGEKVSAELIIPDSLNAPVKEGEAAGSAVFTLNGERVYIINLETTTETKKKKSFFQKIFGD